MLSGGGSGGTLPSETPVFVLTLVAGICGGKPMFGAGMAMKLKSLSVEYLAQGVVGCATSPA
jgi:hypothetical protein